MPRFFFHVTNSVIASDREGTECADLQSAQTQAVETAGAMLRDQPNSLQAGLPWCLRVTDENGTLLFSLNVALRPAEQQGRRRA